MSYRIFIDTFSGGIGDMTAKDQRDKAKVLAVLNKHPLLSVFDATERPAIARTLDDLKDRGYIEYNEPQPEFPWSRVAITAKGMDFLKDTQQ